MNHSTFQEVLLMQRKNAKIKDSKGEFLWRTRHL